MCIEKDDEMGEFVIKNGPRRLDYERQIMMDSLQKENIINLHIQHYGINPKLDKKEYLLCECEYISEMFKLDNNSIIILYRSYYIIFKSF